MVGGGGGGGGGGGIVVVVVVVEALRTHSCNQAAAHYMMACSRLTIKCYGLHRLG